MSKTERLMIEFTETYMEKIFYFCLKKTGNEQEAEDLTSDISLNILAALNRETIPENFSAWVWKIARNRYSVWAERNRKINHAVCGDSIEEQEIASDDPSVLEELIQREQLALLRRELSFISSSYRNLVVAYYIDHRKIGDIAASLHLPEGTVTSALHRARKRLKEGMSMAREFGKLSYNPENISFINNGIYGSNGEPWTYLSRLLCKNIMLAAYRRPATAEELAVEVGVALPYMEEELNRLVEATLMKKNGNRYETNFFIVSASAQEKIFAHLRKLAPELTKAVIASLEFEVSWKNGNCPNWHEGYQSYEEMKWALLMREVDTINFYTLPSFNQTTAQKQSIGPMGHTLRPNGGEWDILGMEAHRGDEPSFVGLYGCVSDPTEKDFPEIHFRQFSFQHIGGEASAPKRLTYADGQALVSVAKGEAEQVNEVLLQRLVAYGYLEKGREGYRPTFLVMVREKSKSMPSESLDELERLRGKAKEIATRHYWFCREQIEKEIPSFLKQDEYQINHACANMFSLRGAVLEEALQIGYLVEPQGDKRNRLGAFLIL